MHIVVLTKGEWMAFRLIMELHRQMDPQQDEIICWDDESPDDWKEQMSMLTKIQTHRLDHDFSKHRNAVKEVIPKNEWILMLDADECIMPGFITAVREKMNVHPDVDALFFQRRNTTWDQTGSLYPEEPDFKLVCKPDFQGRAFRNLDCIHFDGVVHEQLRGYEWPFFLTGPPFCLIHHKPPGDPRYVSWAGKSKP